MEKLRKAIGYSLLALSCLAFAALPVIPFLDYEPEQLAAWAGGLFVFGEITWWVGIPLLGREIIVFGKKLLWLLKKAVQDETTPKGGDGEKND